MSLAAVLLFLAIGLQVADAATTVIALRYKGASESNSLLEPLFKRVGPLVGMVIVKTPLIAILWLYCREQVAVLAFMSILYTVVVGNNLLAIRKLRNREKAQN